MTGLAPHGQADGELLLGAEDCLGELQPETDLGVRAPSRAVLAAPERTSGHRPEEGLEQVAQSTFEVEGDAATGGPGPEDTLRTESVVASTALRVAQDLVGEGHLLELRLGFGIATVGVGVQLSRPPPIGALDLLIRCVRGDPEELVEVRHPVNGHVDVLACHWYPTGSGARRRAGASCGAHRLPPCRRRCRSYDPAPPR